MKSGAGLKPGLAPFFVNERHESVPEHTFVLDEFYAILLSSVKDDAVFLIHFMLKIF